MLNFKISATAVLLFSGVAISSVAAASLGASSILPDIQNASPMIQIVDKGGAVNVKAVEAKLKVALKKLHRNNDFLAALKKKNVETVTRMLAAESGVSAPLSIKISGNGTVENYKIKIHCTYPPLNCDIEIIL